MLLGAVGAHLLGQGLCGAPTLTTTCSVGFLMQISGVYYQDGFIVLLCISLCISRISRVLPFHADLAEQVLDHFRDRFITEMDANAIVMELEHRGIISNGDREAIKQERDASQQNQLLHARLKKTCTVQALMHVCGIITMVEGNPKLKSLGIDMKTELEKGLSCVVNRTCTWCMHMYVVCECMHLIWCKLQLSSFLAHA